MTRLLLVLSLFWLAVAAPAVAQENDSSPGIAAPAPERGSAEPRTDLADLEDEVMCPICGTALGLSEAPQADRQREFIRELIAEGRTKDEVKDALVAEYGEEVLAVPEARDSISPRGWFRAPYWWSARWRSSSGCGAGGARQASPRTFRKACRRPRRSASKRTSSGTDPEERE